MNNRIKTFQLNAQQQKKPNHGVNIGSSSILMIFVLLCLVSFATLAIVSAYSDYKLSMKVVDRTTAYYEACTQAEIELDTIDQSLATIYSNSSSKEEYFASAGEEISYIVPINDLQSLSIELTILYPEKNDDSFYQIQSWQVITTGTLEYDDTLPVIK